jgi:hypothetical protein
LGIVRVRYSRTRAASQSCAAGGQNFYPVERYGVKLISMGFFLTDKTPVI